MGEADASLLSSRPITKSLTSATNSIQHAGDADKVKNEAEARTTNRDVAKSRVALHLFETQSTRPSDPLGSVGGWQRSVESGATATGVDEDGRVIVPEDGLYLLYAQEGISSDHLRKRRRHLADAATHILFFARFFCRFVTGPTIATVRPTRMKCTTASIPS